MYIKFYLYVHAVAVLSSLLVYLHAVAVAGVHKYILQIGSFAEI